MPTSPYPRASVRPPKCVPDGYVWLGTYLRSRCERAGELSTRAISISLRKINRDLRHRYLYGSHAHYEKNRSSVLFQGAHEAGWYNHSYEDPFIAATLPDSLHRDFEYVVCLEDLVEEVWKTLNSILPPGFFQFADDFSHLEDIVNCEPLVVHEEF